MYGIDVESDDLLQRRSWRWLRIRIGGLFSTDSRVQRHFAPPEPAKPVKGGRHGAQPR